MEGDEALYRATVSSSAFSPNAWNVKQRKITGYKALCTPDWRFVCQKSLLNQTRNSLLTTEK